MAARSALLLITLLQPGTLDQVRRREYPPTALTAAAAHADDRLKRAKALAPVVGWPVLIALVVLVVLHDFAFGGRITNQHQDVFAQWLPWYCFAGKSIAAGHIPAWNPYSMAGAPFAADPETGWTYAPAMVLFSVLRCDVAMRWYIVLLPIGAGLGLYAFLRTERISRMASAAGGLVIALVMADSYILLQLPFAASITWTAILLAAAARYLRAPTWRGRLRWALAVALCWGQLAAAHLSNGLVIGTTTLAFYVTARLVQGLRRERMQPGEALALAGLLVVALPLLNLAYFLPRLSYLRRTSIGLGYGKLQALGDRLAGRAARRSLFTPGMRPTWPLGLAVSPGSYLGAAALAFSLGWWRSRRRVFLALAFALYGAVSYLLTLRAFAAWVGGHFSSSSLVDFYLHEPTRFRYGLIIALSVLVGMGVEAWRHASSPRERVLMLAPGMVLWWIGPFLFHVPGASSLLFVVGMAATAVLAVRAAGKRPAVALIPLLIAAELVANGLAGQAVAWRSNGIGNAFSASGGFPPLRRPTIDAAAYMQPTPISGALQSLDGGRYVSDLPNVLPGLGYVGLQRPPFWGLLANSRSMLFDLPDVQGFNPVQLLRFWEFDRTVDPAIEYHQALFRHPTPAVLDLLQVGWVIGAAAAPPPIPDLVPVTRDGQWELYSLPDVSPRASVYTSWTVLASSEMARRAVGDPAFDPSGQLVLEEAPGVSPSSLPGGTASYRRTGNQSAEVAVSVPRAAVVLVRVPFDPGWRASVDGRRTPVMPADFFLQGIAVPAGRHLIRLGYDDPTIGFGLLGSALSIAALLAAAFALGRRGRPGPRADPQSSLS